VSATATIIAVTGDYSITANFEEKPPINWTLLDGIIAGVLAVVLIILFGAQEEDCLISLPAFLAAKSKQLGKIIDSGKICAFRKAIIC
jgi:uncharacterized membrane protein HdeD (DUF308 family)